MRSPKMTEQRKSRSRNTDSQKHWESVYSTRTTDQVSWYQVRPQLSLRLIRNSGIGFEAPIIDVGGGASNLVDALLEKGYSNITVMDISEAALNASRARLGELAERVRWITADVAAFEPDRRFALWHDRALFHFMTRRKPRRAYIESMRRALRNGGQAIIATFAVHGPRKCSGLEVVRYDAEHLLDELGPGYEMLQTVDETHLTPAGAVQEFTYFRLRRL
jgi:ubiquinone/menaquinone biosynthesis C-methylase UbiE